MGVITNCCTSKSIIQSSSISVYSLSGIDSTQNNDIYKDIIPPISDLDQACKFITSKEYYPLLQKKIPKHIISKKICLKLNNKDIMKLINNLYQWILHEEFEKCDESTKKNITLIKDNTKTSLNYVLKELTNTQLDNQKLLEAKKKQTETGFMDQNALNTVFKGRIKFLPIIYNFMCCNLERASNLWSITQLNKLYQSKYPSYEDLKGKAVIVHYASKDKPWTNTIIPEYDLWFSAFNNLCEKLYEIK